MRFHRAIEIVGARWNGAILRAIFTGQHRFRDIKAAIPGVSDTMLAQRLKELEEAQIVVREVSPTTPVSVSYELSERGRELAPVLDELLTWSHKWVPLPETVR